MWFKFREAPDQQGPMVDLAAQVYPAAKETQEPQDFQESQVLNLPLENS